MTLEERNSAYDAMTTEKVGAPVVGLGLVCLVVITYLLVDLDYWPGGHPAACDRDGPLRS